MSSPLAAETRLRVAVGAALAIAAFAVYAPVRGHEFLVLDDYLYVSENPYVQAGMTPDSLRWALTKPFFTMWTPVTLLSYLIGSELFGPGPASTLLVNAAIHALAAWLLFAALARMTGRTGPSAFVAAVFALHPLHVESVAWASERKDVVCAFFWMATLLAHARHAARPSLGRLAWVWLAGAMALASKPMAVTLPFALLLLDVWPLRRIDAATRDRGGAFDRPVLEKLPLFALVAAVVAWTLSSHPAAGLLGPAQPIPLTLRAANALVAYVSYLGAIFWPTELAIFYPYPASIPLWKSASAAALLLAISLLALRAVRHRGYLFTGWFWYLGTLVPVIGLVQAGDQSMADRYTYVPSVGISLALAWGAVDLGGLAVRRRLLLALGAALCVALAVATSLQLRHWRDGVALFAHTRSVAGDDPRVRHLLGLSLLRDGRIDEGVAELAGAGAQRTRVARRMATTGDAQERSGDLMTAVVYYRAAVAIEPESVAYALRLGRALLRQTRYDAAIGVLRAASERAPNDPETHFNLGLAHELAGQPRRAEASYRRALRLRPGSRDIADRLRAVARGPSPPAEGDAHRKRQTP